MQTKDLVLGIDIGGTNTAFGFVDRQGSVVLSGALPTQPRDSAEVFVARLCDHIETAKEGLVFLYRLRGIGIGAPNAHHSRGTVENPPNLNWGEKVDLSALIRRRCPLPVSITNDANAAALGEMLFGGARGMQHFMVLTIGTGLGSGIVVDGRLVYGASGFAGELGHTVVDPDGRPCACGKRGCLEAYVSAPGLVKTALELLENEHKASGLRDMPHNEITSQKIFELARAGDVIALAVVDKTAQILGMKVADAVAHTSPEAIFLTGGVSRSGDLLLKPAQTYMNTFLFGVYRGAVKLLPSALPAGESAVLGAAALIWSELTL